MWNWKMFPLSSGTSVIALPRCKRFPRCVNSGHRVRLQIQWLIGRRAGELYRLADINMERRPRGGVGRAPIDAIKGPDLQAVADLAGDEGGLGQLGGGDIDHRAGCLGHAIDHKMTTEGIADGIPQLVPGHGVAVSVCDRE